MKLTKPQREELQRIAKEPQNTYGSHRARVQNSLSRLRLVTYTNADGTPSKYRECSDRCAITDAGLAALASHRTDSAKADRT